MNKTLTALYDSFYTPPQAADTRTEIEVLHKQLILKLDKPERRLVLRLIDTKDRMTEDTSVDSFICGFRLAWRLANELSNYPESGRPTRSNQTGQDARVVPQERGIFRTRVSPCWPLCGRLWALLKRTGGWAQRAQPYIPLRQKFRQHPISADAPPDDLLWNLAAVPFAVTLLQEIHIWIPLPNRFNEYECTGCIFPANARILPSSPGI